MIIPEHYKLSNEIANEGHIHIANFSMFQKLCDERNIKDAIIKYGNSTFVNSRSIDVPQNFRKIMQTHKLTSLMNSTLLTYFCSEFECSKSDLLKSDIILRDYTVASKQFIEFTQDMVDIIDKKICTNINLKDYNECLSKNYIDGGIKLSKNNYFVWY